MKARRLLFVHDGKMKGKGLDLVSDYLLRALADTDIAVTFISRGRVDYPHVHCPEVRFNGAKLAFWMSRPYYYGASKRFFSYLGSRELRRNPYDLVMTWARGANSLFREARRRRIPTLLHAGNLHCDSDREQNPERLWPAINKGYRREEYGLADRIFVASQFAAADFVAHGFSEDRITVLHRGYDPEVFYPSNQVLRKFRVLMCGHLSERKGLHIALAAWRQAALPNAELWLVGSIASEMRAEVARHASKGVVAKGLQKDVAPLMRQCNLNLLPSRNEGLAKVLIEGAACGLPILATPEAGFPVEDGEMGYLISRDPQDIAQRLRQLHQEPQRVKAMGAAAAAYVAEHFSWADFMRVFREFVESRIFS